MMRLQLVTALVTAFMGGLLGCEAIVPDLKKVDEESDTGSGTGTGTGSDTGSGSDTDTDTDTDGDTDSDPPSSDDSDSGEAGTDADTDTDTDTDTDADTDADTDSDGDADALEWIEIASGYFFMGSDGYEVDEKPPHTVTFGAAFEMTKTEVTVAQYQACVAGKACDEPMTEQYCNWGLSGRGGHPVNCLTWSQARAFCAWASASLPTEAEWEYAARSQGIDQTYPWGNQEATCYYAVKKDPGGDIGCDQLSTWEVCSKTAGHTVQGLCDMAGNVWEWVEDWHHASYDAAPDDGTAWASPATDKRVVRGGGFYDETPTVLRATNRAAFPPDYWHYGVGFRCVR